MSSISTIDILYFVFVATVASIIASVIASIPQYMAKIKDMRKERIM